MKLFIQPLHLCMVFKSSWQSIQKMMTYLILEESGGLDNAIPRSSVAKHYSLGNSDFTLTFMKSQAIFGRRYKPTVQVK